MHGPDIQQQAGNDTEADYIGQGIQFGAEFAGTVQEARDAPIERIEDGRYRDGRHRQFPALH
jgi:hypothetical protein